MPLTPTSVAAFERLVNVFRSMALFGVVIILVGNFVFGVLSKGATQGEILGRPWARQYLCLGRHHEMAQRQANGCQHAPATWRRRY